MKQNELTRNSVNQGDIKKIYLENTSNNHYKFYIISRKRDENKWLAQWGKIGTKPQSLVYEYSKITPYDQLQAKLKKDYKVISSDTFKDIIENTTNEALEYLKSIGIDVDSLDDILF